MTFDRAYCRAYFASSINPLDSNRAITAADCSAAIPFWVSFRSKDRAVYDRAVKSLNAYS